jgi:PAS domain S-box-containing protein
MQTLGATALVGYISYRNGQHAVKTLANQLLSQASERVSDRLSAYLQPSQQIVTLNHSEAEQGALDLNVPEQLRQRLWQQIKVNPSIPSNIFWGDGGSGLGYGRITSREEQDFARKVTGTSFPIGTLYFHEYKTNQRRYYLIDPLGKPQKLVYTYGDDFRKLNWYRQAKAASTQQHWTPIFVGQVIPGLQILAVSPVYDRTGKFRGLFTSNYLLSNFSAFLNSLSFSSKGQAFILERSGELVATSFAPEASAMVQVSGKPSRLLAVNSQDERTREVSKQLLQKFGGFDRLKSIQQLKVPTGGEQQFVQVTPYRNSYGLDWLVVTVVPESDFMTEVQARNGWTILLCWGTLFVTIALGLLVSKRITDPLHRLNVSAHRIAQNQFNQKIDVSGLGEVRQLSQTFQQMAEQLRLSFQLRTNYEQELQHQVAERTAELAQAKDLREAIFNESADAIFLVEPPPTTRILDCNQRAVELFEVESKSELIGIQGSTLQKQPYTDEELREIAADLSRNGFWSREIEYVTKSGKSFWGNLAAKPIQVAGQQMQLVRLTDISDRKQAEEQLYRTKQWLQQYSRQSPGSIYTLVQEPDGHIWFEYVSSAVEALHEVTQAQVLENAHLMFEHMHPDDRADYEAAVARSMERLELFSHEWRIITPSGKLKWLQAKSQPERRSNGAIAWHGVVQDVSDRYRLDAMKDEFISVVSHELRTPLTSICGSLGILETGTLNDEPETAKRMLSVALRNTNRLVRLVNDILDLHRLESGKMPLVMEGCQVSNLMEQAVESMQVIADQEGVTLEWIPLSTSIEASPDAIVQTLTNLLSNAIKFSPKGSTVWLKAELWEIGEDSKLPPLAPPLPLPSTPSHILFSITDQGRGIPQDKLETIFGRFQQVDSSDSRQKGGTGLGLAICRSIVQQHRGQIWVESVLGQGSTFYFTLPVTPSKQAIE